jgi:adenylosuccinate synthase
MKIAEAGLKKKELLRKRIEDVNNADELDFKIHSLKEEEEKQINDIRASFPLATSKVEETIKVYRDKIKHIEDMQGELNQAFQLDTAVSFIQASKSANSISQF